MMTGVPMRSERWLVACGAFCAAACWVAGCAPTPDVLLDVSPAADAAPTGDAGFVVDAADAGMLDVDGAVAGDADALGAIDAATSDGDGGATDAASASDAGVDASSPAVDAASALCGNGYIDPGEVCDPGEVYPDGGTMPITDSPWCHGCTVIGCPGGGIDPVTNWCVVVAEGMAPDPSTIRPATRWPMVYWDTAAELTGLLTAIAAIGPDEQGQVALRRFGGVTGTWYMYREDGTSFVPTDMPAWVERFPLADPSYCAELHQAASGALSLQQTTCGRATDVSAQFVFSPPPGIAH